MSAPPISASPPSPDRRWLKRLVLVLILVFGLALGMLVYYRVVGDGGLEDVVAELDLTDPNWKWHDLHRTRAQIPDAENAALRVLSANSKMPGAIGLIGFERPAEQQLDTALLNQLRAAMLTARPVLDEATLIAEMPRGRFPVPTDIDVWMREGLAQMQSTRSIVNLLLEDTALHAQEGRPREALRQARAAFNAGRAIGDEPGLISHLVRLACTNTAAVSMERVLAQSQPDADALLATQKLIELELGQPTLLWAMRGERAWQHEFAQQLRDPRFVAQLGGQEPGWFDDVKLWLSAGSMRAGRARILEHLNEIIKACELPAPERRRALDQLHRSIKARVEAANKSGEGRGGMLLLTAPAYEKYAEAFHRNQALLASGAAAFAAERYRQKHGRWPVALDQLVPEFISKLPDDPFASGALRLARLADGIVIYSVGPDEKDDGGTVQRNAGPVSSTDIGFRLWDVPKRRQSAAKLPVEGAMP